MPNNENSLLKSSMLIVRREGAFRPYFPDIIKCANQDLLIAFYWNEMHAPMKAEDPKGVIQTARSKDNGQTWEPSETVVDFRSSNLDCRDPNLHLLPDGTMLLTFFTYSYYEQADNRKYTETYICRSEDFGRSWSEPVRLTNSNLWNAKQGTMGFLDNGDLLLVTYGSKTYNSEADTYRLVCMRSTDNGLTWSDEVEIGDSTPGHSLNEACLVNMGKHGIYCLAREEGDLFVSLDNGATWTFMEKVDPVQRPHFLKIDDDRVFVSWCDPSGFRTSRDVNRRVVCKMFDLRFGWKATHFRTIYDPIEKGLADMGYPSSILLDEGHILTVYYDSREGFVAGTVTDLDDWMKG